MPTCKMKGCRRAASTPIVARVTSPEMSAEVTLEFELLQQCSDSLGAGMVPVGVALTQGDSFGRAPKRSAAWAPYGSVGWRSVIVAGLSLNRGDRTRWLPLP